MRKHLLFFFLVALSYINFLRATVPPFFSNKLTTHTYFGQDLNILEDIDSFDNYSLFQYIYDFGIHIEKKPTEEKKRSLSFVANARMKGIFGTIGLGFVPLQEDEKFQIWMKEFSLQYAPTENQNSFVKMGFFPFKVGNGFVLGNAYDINIPTSWQYIYEQINQFRPGILLQVGNEKGSINVDSYLGFIASNNNLQGSATTFVSALMSKILEDTDIAALGNDVKGNIVAAVQANFSQLWDNKLKVSPYLFFHRTKQSLEILHDTESKLYTPGFCGSYQHNNWKITFEFAKNFGHQQVSEIDRNQILANGSNTELFYAPYANISLNSVTNKSFIPSDVTIPAALGEIQGNGTNFLYSPTTGRSFVFKNSYNRIRNSYKNRYAGFLIYLDAVLTKNNVTWGSCFAYSSGDHTPNDSPDTILVTRLIPNAQYKDHNKTYKGFVGTNQFSEAVSVNGLYFGIGDFRYTNLTLFGSTLQYSVPKEEGTLSAQATFVSYFKPVAPILNIFNQQGENIAPPLPHYLGTELNWSSSYALGSHITFGLAAGIFFPGKFARDLRGQEDLITLQVLSQLKKPGSTLPQTLTIPTKTNHCFFASMAFSWLFDSNDLKKLIKNHP